MRDIKEKYVVMCYGKSSGVRTYLQDESLFKSTDRSKYWTQYAENAMLFDTKEDAEDEIKKRNLKYNDPAVGLIVDKNRVLRL